MLTASQDPDLLLAVDLSCGQRSSWSFPLAFSHSEAVACVLQAHEVAGMSLMATSCWWRWPLGVASCRCGLFISCASQLPAALAEHVPSPLQAATVLVFVTLFWKP